MTTTFTASRLLGALGSGLITTAYYATPDVIASRTARGWAKAGIVAVSLAVDLPELRAGLTTRRAAAAADVPASTEGSVSAGGVSGADLGEPSASRVSGVRLAAVGALAVGAAVAGAVGVERWLFRRGEARAAAGVRFAHTRHAAVLGAMTVALTLLPSPSDEEDTGGTGVRAA